MHSDISIGPYGDFGWFGGALFRLDRWLRRRQGIFEFTDNDICLCRIQRGSAEERVTLSDGLEIKRAAPVIDPHLWNEHVPAMNGQGATMRWARRVSQALEFSLRELSCFLAEHREFDDIVAIRGELRFTAGNQNDQLVRLCERCCFKLVGSIESKSSLSRIGDNILMLLLALAINPPTAYKSIFRRGRQLPYLSRGTLEKRYGPHGDTYRGIGERSC